MSTSIVEQSASRVQPEWQAKFITTTLTTDKSEPLRPVRFKKVFLSDHDLGDAKLCVRLYITCHGVYEAYLNGKRIGDHILAPGWTSYKHRLHYQTFDVTAFLQPGSNVLGIEVAEGWYAGRLGWGKGRTRIYGSDLSALVQLEFEDLTNKCVKRVVSDDTWGWAYSAITSSGIYDGEVYDMREEDKDWLSDKDMDENVWKPVRSADVLEERVLLRPKAPPARITQFIRPVQITQVSRHSALIDFGQNVTGKIGIRNVQKPANHTITFRHAEVLENGKLCLRPLRAAKATDMIISNGHEGREWSPKYTFHGFRYVEVEGWSMEDEKSPLTYDNVSALVIHTDMKRTGHFHCSNDLVNRLHGNVVWSMRDNFLTVPTDCPQRDERLGWTGDIQVFAPSANFLFDTSGILSDWLQDLAFDQAENNGVVPCVVPDVLQGDPFSYEPQAIWDDAAILVPWELYQSYGDPDVLRRQYSSMQTHLDEAIIRGPDYLWREDVWQLADWLDPSAPPQEPGLARTDGVLVADAYLVHVTTIMNQIATILDRTGDAGRYLKDSSRLRSRFQEKYISPIGRVVSDTQTAISLVLCFKLYRSTAQARIAADRLAVLVRQLKFRVSTGFCGTPLILHALSSHGHANIAYRMLLETQCPSWLYPVTMGATTIWERWDSMLPDGTINPGQMTSFNHYALGAVANWLHSVVGGISPLEPGWSKVLVRPVPGGTIRSAEVRYESVQGEIRCEWKIDGEKRFRLMVEVPPDTIAVVVLPEQGRNTITEDRALNVGEELGPGTWHFECSCDYYDDWPPKPLLTQWRAAEGDSETYA